jgi:hypothetical protein
MLFKVALPDATHRYFVIHINTPIHTALHEIGTALETLGFYRDPGSFPLHDDL